MNPVWTALVAATVGYLLLRRFRSANAPQGELEEHELYEGVDAEIRFPAPGPMLTDLLALCELGDPDEAPASRYAFAEYTGLGFDQVDDFYGIPSDSAEGPDELVTLSPIVEGEEVFHHEGPFDSLRLNFNVLCTDPRHAELFLKCVEDLSQLTPEPAPDVGELRAKIDAVAAHWRSKGITPGSDEALEIEY